MVPGHLCFSFFFWHTETRWVVLVNIFFLFFRQVATEKTFSVSSPWFQSKPEECWKDNATTTTTKKVATFNVKDLTVFRTKIKAHLWFVGWLRYDKILHVSKSEAGETTTTCYCVLPPGWRCMSWYVTRCHPRTGMLYCGGFSKSPQLLRTCHHNRKTQNYQPDHTWRCGVETRWAGTWSWFSASALNSSRYKGSYVITIS